MRSDINKEFEDKLRFVILKRFAIPADIMSGGCSRVKRHLNHPITAVNLSTILKLYSSSLMLRCFFFRQKKGSRMLSNR